MAIPAGLLQKILRGGKAFGRKALNLPDLDRAATAGRRAAQFKPGAGARRDPSVSPMWGGPPFENPLSTEVVRRGAPPRTSMENFREARRRGLPEGTGPKDLDFFAKDDSAKIAAIRRRPPGEGPMYGGTKIRKMKDLDIMAQEDPYEYVDEMMRWSPDDKGYWMSALSDYHPSLDIGEMISNFNKHGTSKPSSEYLGTIGTGGTRRKV